MRGYLVKTRVGIVISTAHNRGIAAQKVGMVGGARLSAEGGFDISLHEAHMEYENWLPNYMAT